LHMKITIRDDCPESDWLQLIDLHPCHIVRTRQERFRQAVRCRECPQEYVSIEEERHDDSP